MGKGRRAGEIGLARATSRTHLTLAGPDRTRRAATSSRSRGSDDHAATCWRAWARARRQSRPRPEPESAVARSTGAVARPRAAETPPNPNPNPNTETLAKP